MSKQLINEIQEFLKGVESTQGNIERLVSVSVNEFNNSSVNKLIGGNK